MGMGGHEVDDDVTVDEVIEEATTDDDDDGEDHEVVEASLSMAVLVLAADSQIKVEGLLRFLAPNSWYWTTSPEKVSIFTDIDAAAADAAAAEHTNTRGFLSTPPGCRVPTTSGNSKRGGGDCTEWCF